MAKKTMVEKAAETVGFGLAMAEDVADTVKTAIGGALTTVTEVLKKSPAKKAAKKTVTKTPAKKATNNSAVKKTPAKKAVKKAVKKVPAKKAALKSVKSPGKQAGRVRR